MKYFFLAYIVIVLLVIGIFGFRGDKFSQPPLELLPDMDHQDKLKGQRASGFFENGMGARKPVLGTVPRGTERGVLPIEFSAGRSDYYATGVIEGKYGNGMPELLETSDEGKARGLINRGKEMYGVHCAICHGDDGAGKGVVAHYLGKAETPVTVANLNSFPQSSHPDGYIFHVISNGKGLMGGYKHNLPLRDRWAITAYLRVLQAAK